MVVKRKVDAGLDHDVAEGKQHIIVGGHSSAKLLEVVVHFSFLDFRIFDHQQVYPLQEVRVEVLLELSQFDSSDFLNN